MLSICPSWCVSGRSLVGYSQFPNEAEILLSPNCKFIVTEECRLDSRDGYHYVDLMEMMDGAYVF